MTVAVIALAAALAAAIGGLIMLALKALDAERRCGDARSDESAMAVRFENMTAQRDNESRRADDERTRADALDDLLAHSAVAGPVTGAYERLLQGWRDARSAHRGGPGAVPAPASATGPRPNDLLKPGE